LCFFVQIAQKTTAKFTKIKDFVNYALLYARDFVILCVILKNLILNQHKPDQKSINLMFN